MVYPGNPQGRHFNETGPRGVYLVEADDGDRFRPQFRAVDSIRWEHIAVDISPMETEQDLLDALHERMQGVLDDAGNRHVLVRVTLRGRGRLTDFLRRTHAENDLSEQINDAWVDRTPFLWCDRVEDETRATFDREGRLAGSDFLAEVLMTVDRAREDPARLTRLREGLADLYQHHRFRRHLDHAPDDDDLLMLLEEAESMAVNLLSEDDE